VAAGFVQDKLKSLGLSVGDQAWVRFYVGSVPGMEPTPGLIHVFLYSDDKRHGLMLLADKNDAGGFVAVRNGYELTKQGSRWNADEGFGGVKTYEIMSRISTRVFLTKPRYRVRLQIGRVGCTVG